VAPGASTDSDPALLKTVSADLDAFAAALGKLEGAAGDLEAMIEADLVTEAEGQALLEAVVAFARELASDAIADAEGGDPAKLAEASAALLEGDTLREEGRSKDAVAKYKDAYATAAGA
jgi:hypothetical protein